MLQQILISRCLLGEAVRYDARAAACVDPRIDAWRRQGRLVGICPEITGGLPTPRAAAEISAGDGNAVLEGLARVSNANGEDMSTAFIQGAQAALSLAQRKHIEFALLKANSPSCGNQQIYDGKFSGQLIEGTGVTTALLQAHGIRVFNEHQLDQLDQALRALTTKTTAGS